MVSRSTPLTNRSTSRAGTSGPHVTVFTLLETVTFRSGGGKSAAKAVEQSAKPRIHTNFRIRIENLAFNYYDPLRTCDKLFVCDRPDSIACAKVTSPAVHF